jgi:hypothetical protein
MAAASATAHLLVCTNNQNAVPSERMPGDHAPTAPDIAL